MTIDPLHFDDCPTHEPTRQLLRTVVKEQAIAANLREIKVTTEAQAKELKFPGSPTIRVNGKDIDEGHEGAYGLKCRVYAGPQGFAGVPPKELVERALERANHGRSAHCC